MKKILITLVFSALSLPCFCWGFYAHRMINQYAVFLLPPEMLVLYKPNIDFLSEHAVDPDKRRYAVEQEGPRHFIDIDNYGEYPYPELPRKWEDAVEKFGEDSLIANGIVPWHIQRVLWQLTNAFKEKDFSRIMRYSTDLGHYIADAHVPLHASNNHDGQLTGQKGIHGFWESRIPELLAEKQFDFFIGKAVYIDHPSEFIWGKVLESSLAADSVLRFEKTLNENFDKRSHAFEKRNNNFTRQYSSEYTIAYNEALGGMVERRMRESIFAVASFWYTAWVNAGQPDLKSLANQTFSESDLKDFEKLNEGWRSGGIKDREHE